MNVSTETVRLRESKRKREEEKREASLKHYRENKQSTARKTKESSGIKSGREASDEPIKAKKRRLKWKLDKWRQRFKAKEQKARNKEIPCQSVERQRDEHDTTDTETGMCFSAFPSRMSKKRNVDSVKKVSPRKSLKFSQKVPPRKPQ